MKNKLRYAIIGGGAAGCTMAWHLTRNGHDVCIYEKERGVGGLASDITFGQTKLDRFYHHIFTSDTHVTSFVDRVGLSSKLHWCDSSVGFEHQGKFYPFTTPLDLIRFSPLSLLSRFRVGLAVLKMKRRETYLDLESITAEELIIKAMGQEAYRILWEPLLRSKFGERYKEVSAVWFWGKMKLRGGTRSKSGAGECLGYLKDGWGQLYQRMADQIVQQGGTFHFSNFVCQIQKTESGIMVSTKRGHQEEYDRVLVTPSVPSFIEMTPELPDDYKRDISRIPYQSNITMALGLERPISPHYWLNITDPDSPFVAVIEHTKLFNDPDYGELKPFYLSRYLSSDHPYYSMPAIELKDIFFSYLEKLFPGFSRNEVKSFTLSKAQYAQPVVGLNYSKNKPSFDTPIKGLHLCTMLQIYPEDRGMNYSIKIAEEMLCHLGELEKLSC
jgi:protoporphyrinogen oxidase